VFLLWIFFLPAMHFKNTRSLLLSVRWNFD